MLNSLLKINYLNILKLFLILFLLTLLFSHNLIYFFISWVGLNISLYGLLLSGRWTNLGASEATVKYFTVGVMVTVFLLFTLVLFAINYLTFEYDTISYLFLKKTTYINQIELVKFNLNITQKLFYTTICSAFLFKLGAFPFHFYLADLYEALDLKKNMLMYTIILKVFILLAMLNIVSKFWFISDIFYPLIITSAIGSLFISSFGAISQVKLRRFWAHSYLNSLGFTLLALSSGISFGFGALTFYACKVYFISYIVAWFGIFLVLTVSAKGSNNYINSGEIYFITDLLKFNVNNNYLDKKWVVLLLICLISLMGLPPTLGFYAKTLVYLGLIASSKSQVLLFIVLCMTPIMAFSYLKLLVYLIYPTLRNGGNININRVETFAINPIFLYRQFFIRLSTKNKLLGVVFGILMLLLVGLPFILLIQNILI